MLIKIIFNSLLFLTLQGWAEASHFSLPAKCRIEDLCGFFQFSYPIDFALRAGEAPFAYVHGEEERGMPRYLLKTTEGQLLASAELQREHYDPLHPLFVILDGAGEPLGFVEEDFSHSYFSPTFELFSANVRLVGSGSWSFLSGKVLFLSEEENLPIAKLATFPLPGNHWTLKLEEGGIGAIDPRLFLMAAILQADMDRWVLYPTPCFH